MLCVFFYTIDVQYICFVLYIHLCFKKITLESNMTGVLITKGKFGHSKSTGASLIKYQKLRSLNN